jgi:hypothetical protein
VSNSCGNIQKFIVSLWHNIKAVDDDSTYRKRI